MIAGDGIKLNFLLDAAPLCHYRQAFPGYEPGKPLDES
jgi:hypothetical protein